MDIKASGRSALIITAGLWMCFAGPMRATESDARASDAKATESTGAPIALNKFAKPRSKKHIAVASRKSGKVAAKTPDASKAGDADTASAEAASSTIPASVANANAQLQAGDTPANNALKIAAAQADSVLKTTVQGGPAGASVANTELVSADQLNEVDRSLGDDKADKAPAPTMAMAAMQMPARSDDSAWNQTSLIGRIFIAFGGLLTLASAARMFMA
jgi:hypothetical protein